MLTGLGFSAFSASAICLLANTAPVAFGSIGIPIVTLAGTTGLPLNELSAAVGRMCAPISLIIPAYVIVATGGFVSLSGIWLPTLTCGAVFAGVQFLISNYVGPQLTDILAALSSMAALVVYLRFWHPKQNESSASIRNCLEPAFVPVVNEKTSSTSRPATNNRIYRNRPPRSAHRRPDSLCVDALHLSRRLRSSLGSGSHPRRARLRELQLCVALSA